QPIFERLGGDRLGVIGRFGGCGDGAAHLAGFASGVVGLWAVADVLLAGSGLRLAGAVVHALPAGVSGKRLTPLLGKGRCGEASAGEQREELPAHHQSSITTDTHRHLIYSEEGTTSTRSLALPEG